MKMTGYLTTLILVFSSLAGGATNGGEPTETVPYEDGERFAGDW
jgi:hypothetical protein